MGDISNRTLALMLVTSIVLSLGITVWTLNNLGQGFTGMVTNEYGNVSLYVQNQVSIILTGAAATKNFIDFGTGAVNTSCTLVTASSYANLAKISNHTTQYSFIDVNDCWTGTPAGTGFVIENNGNLNASISVNGPQTDVFFKNYAGSNTRAITVRGESVIGDNGCTAELNSTWTNISNNMTICRDLKWDTDSTDAVGVSVNLSIPKDLATGLYNASVIEFYAKQS